MSNETIVDEWILENSVYVVIDTSDIACLIDLLKGISFDMGPQDLKISYEHLLKRINYVIAKNYERKTIGEEEEN